MTDKNKKQESVMFNGEPYDVYAKFNITRKELEAAIKFSIERGSCVTISKGSGNVGGMTFVGENWDNEVVDMSDYDAT